MLSISVNYQKLKLKDLLDRDNHQWAFYHLFLAELATYKEIWLP